MSMPTPAGAPAPGATENPTPAPAPAAPAAPVPTPPPAAAPASTAQSGATQGHQQQEQQNETPEQIVARLQADVQRLEREKQDARIQKEGQIKQEAKRQELLNVARVAGIEVADPATETIESLTEKLTGKVMKGDETTIELQQAKIELAVYRSAALPDVRVDPDRLTNRVSFVKAASALDPSAPDFNDKLKAVILAEAQNDPSIRIGGTGAVTSGPDQYGGAGGGQITKEAFAKMGVGERTALYRANPELFARLSD